MKFDHGAFQVSDIDKAIEFYTKKLGFKLKFQSINKEEKEAYAFVELGEARIELIQDLITPFNKSKIVKPFCPHFCIEIDDMKKGIELLHKHNINIIKGPLEIKGEETWVYFSDPDNNILEYIQWYKKK
jgi:lactoylglutathione lyase